MSSPDSTLTLLPQSTSSSVPLPNPSYSNSSVSAPPEVEATIQRLSQHKNVRAVIILNKNGVVIRSAGQILQGSDGLLVLRRYASESRKMVEAMSKFVEGMEVDVSILVHLKTCFSDSKNNDSHNGLLNPTQDQLRLLRIRTRLHELLITPDPNFTLIVVQDPTK